MKFQRLVFADFDQATLPEEIWERARGSAEEIVLVDASSPGYRSVVAGADGLILRLGLSADAELLGTATKLRYIGVLATDFGRIDTEAAKRHGVVVSNIADYSTRSVAEFALGMALDMFRDLSAERFRGEEGDFGETQFVGRELSALNVGVVGAGNLGRRFAEIMSGGIGANVSYWSRTRRPELEAASGVTYLPLSELVAQSDLLSVHVALNADTEGLLNAQLVRSLPHRAGLISTVPNEIFDLQEVLARCMAGELRFATDHGGDLSSEELVQARQTSDVLLYAPIGYATSEATQRKFEVLVANIEAFLNGAPTNHVNP